MLISLPGGELLREHAPVAWQDIGGQRVFVSARFALDRAAAHFELGAYDANLPLAIDPTLTVGTYLGGGSADYGRGVAVDAQGNIYVVGDFFSSDFLGDTTTPSGSKDVIVLKLNLAGTELIYGWFLGGSAADQECRSAGTQHRRMPGRVRSLLLRHLCDRAGTRRQPDLRHLPGWRSR
jgi:hypothetical protein